MSGHTIEGLVLVAACVLLVRQWCLTSACDNLCSIGVCDVGDSSINWLGDNSVIAVTVV